jgi:hypothetical protein
MPTFYGLRITYIVPARHKSQPRAPQALLVTVVYLRQIVVLNDENNRNIAPCWVRGAIVFTFSTDMYFIALYVG